MNERLQRLLLYMGVAVLYLIPLCVIINQESSFSLYTFLQIAGLWGFISLALAAILNLAKKQIKGCLGKPFLPVHHFCAISGLVLVTLHPVTYAYLAGDPLIFIPDISSVYSFFESGGRTGLILIYGAFLAGIFRTALKNHWRYIHMLVYLALLIAVVHANLLGQTLSNPVVFLLVNGLAALVCVTFIYTRYRKVKKNHS